MTHMGVMVAKTAIQKAYHAPSSPAEVEERLYEAILTLRALPDKERKWVYGKLSSWPETLREAIDVMALAYDRLQEGASAYEPMREPRHVPTKEAIDRMDEALDWLCWLDDREKQLITLRAFKMSWVKISWRFGRSDTTVQRWHREAVEKVWRRI